MKESLSLKQLPIVQHSIELCCWAETLLEINVHVTVFLITILTET